MPPAMPTHRSALLTGVALWLSASLACAPQGSESSAPSTRHPMIVVGIDGGEWKVIRDLWEQDRLPNFRRIADEGATATLRTRYTASPIIWTTIATGVEPQAHGITDFVVPTPEGNVPVSSTVRRAPALWNMLTRVRRPVAVLGWWASWPAEEVSGVVVSDRVLTTEDDRVHPPDLLPRVEELIRQARTDPGGFAANEATAGRDRLMDLAARDLVDDDFDLMLIYFRGVDIASHHHWKHYRPGAFADDPSSPEDVDRLKDAIPREYEAVDRALGALLEAAPDANLLVISDHGFKPAHPERIRVLLDAEELLDRLGFADDLRVYPGPDHEHVRGLFFHPDDEARRAEIRSRLERALGRITYAHGAPAFQVRNRRHDDGPGDFALLIRRRQATQELLLDGDPEPLDGVVRQVTHISGTHSESTHGIFLATGPDVQPDADLEGIHIHDMAPTMLFGLGLPVAENFAGRAWTELYTTSYRDRNPVRRIASWQMEREGEVTRSAEDEALLEELGALGYLD